jgi:hypothetical protein
MTIALLLAACGGNTGTADDTFTAAPASSADTVTEATTGVVWQTITVPCAEDADHHFIGAWMPPEGLLAVYAMAYSAESGAYQPGTTSDSGYLPGKMAAFSCAYYQAGTGVLAAGDTVTVTWATLE